MTQHAFKPLLLDLLQQAQVDQNAFFQQLPPTELEIIGEPDYWSAKDHVAHLTFWRRRLVSKLQALLRQETPTASEDFEKVNPIVFAENRYRTWLDILAESDQVYAELITLTEQLQEEDLTAFKRFDWIHEGLPLYLLYMGNCYEHSQIHLGYYLTERHDLQHATMIHEEWTSRVVETEEAPAALKGNLLYNLACFYATHDQLEKAKVTLQQALALYPQNGEFARTDPDLAEL
ncbi:TPR end-of-group domain-containing protein [Dictyobacter formicarum]|uniref:DinB-like domain-containing protein n=1 Tax=Dictyobacter formicarum TaxID=2778368 RepID=A0ABQ3VQ62_9CHLR|nr:DinB family protein [Dictyobacter formicarum]GHO87988.1 hypothetical protein KSZ_59940 [Dictyobacter formicarum]